MEFNNICQDLDKLNFLFLGNFCINILDLRNSLLNSLKRKYCSIRNLLDPSGKIGDVNFPKLNKILRIRPITLIYHILNELLKHAMMLWIPLPGKLLQQSLVCVKVFDAITECKFELKTSISLYDFDPLFSVPFKQYQG